MPSTWNRRWNTMSDKDKAQKNDSVPVKHIMPQAKGQKDISFHPGGLHASTGTQPGQKISAAKHAEAASGRLGPKAAKQENFYRNVLKGK